MSLIVTNNSVYNELVCMPLSTSKHCENRASYTQVCMFYLITPVFCRIKTALKLVPFSMPFLTAADVEYIKDIVEL
jgi:hypothetical protein